MSKPDKQHKERPILFSAPMVRATLDGRKTQTRRVLKPQPDSGVGECGWSGTGYAQTSMNGQCTCRAARCPYGQRGDRLWVRETWQTWKWFDRVRPADLSSQAEIQYPATYDGWDSKRRSPLHMPRWASRLTLEITDIRVERLQDISQTDARAEGCLLSERIGDGDWPEFPMSYKDAYQYLWESINGEGSWDANPWVWVIGFERVTP